MGGGSRWGEDLDFHWGELDIKGGGIGRGNHVIRIEARVGNDLDVAGAGCAEITVGDGHCGLRAVDVDIHDDPSPEGIADAGIGDDQHFAVVEDARESQEAADAERLAEVYLVARYLAE